MINYFIKHGTRAGVIVLLLFLLYASFGAGVSSAGDANAPVSVENIRYERIIREAQELMGGYLSADDAHKRIAELSIEAEDSAGPDFGNRWGISQEQAQSYNDAVDHLFNLYTSYIGSLQNLHGAADVPDFGDGILSGDISITRYDEFRWEHSQLEKRMDDEAFTLKARAAEISSRIAIYKKQRALAESLSKSIHSESESGFTYKREQLRAETEFIVLSIMCARMEAGFTYMRAASDVRRKMGEQLLEARGKISFTSDELGAILSDIQKSITARESELAETIDALAVIGEELNRLIPRAEDYASPGNDIPQQRLALFRNAGNSPEHAQAALLAARYFAERFRLYALSTEINILSDMMTRWHARYDILNGEVASEALWDARADAQSVLGEIYKDEQFVYLNLEDTQSDYISVEALTRDANPEAALTLQNILGVFTEIQMHMHSRIEITIRAYRSLAMGIIEESTEKIDGLRLMQHAVKTAKDFAENYMNKVLWIGDDYEVTVYDMTLAFFILVVGLFVSSLLSRVVIRVISYRRRLDNTLLLAVRRILFYVFAFFCFMLSLDAVGVPMTAFAFAGGTLALAIGLGAKDICSNQISGLMILFSRPFKHGDIIEIDGTSSVVEEIGMRATRVFTFDGVEIIIPNSHFMEHKVVNHTKKSPMTRRNLRVRVGGGCDPNEVREIITEEIKNYRHPIRKIEPFVILTDFSLRSLDFDVYYWIDEKKDNALRVAGAIRENIIRKLRDHGITPYDPMMYILMKEKEPDKGA